MQTLQHTYGHTYTPVAEKQSWASQFITWCSDWEEYRFGWMAAIVAISRLHAHADYGIVSSYIGQYFGVLDHGNQCHGYGADL